MKKLLLATVLLSPLAGFEPAPHPPLERLGFGAPSERCNDDWTLLYEGYSAWKYTDMTCPKFRDLIEGCHVRWWQNNWAHRRLRIWCIAYIGLGVHVDAASDYGWKGYKWAGFSRLGDDDIDRSVQLGRIFLGISERKPDPQDVRSHIERTRQRWLRRRSKGKPTPADRRAAAVEEAVVRARYGP